MDLKLRLETDSDYKEVEAITREAFWNLNFPGCVEHYLIHKMRSHHDFIKELAFVATINHKIVGNIMYTKSRLIGSENKEIPVISFGPISVLPEFQRKGIGSKLIVKTVEISKQSEYIAVVIWGNPKNYVKHEFKNCKEYNIGIAGNKHPTCLLVLELKKGILGKEFYEFKDSDAYSIDEKEAEEFDKNFKIKEKKYQYTQEEFKILSHSFYE